MLPINDPEPQEAIPPEASLTPLTAFDGSLGQKVYLSLRQAILALVFKPGHALDKQEICDRLGVSRSPVSEAVARLAGEGLVEVVPQAGTFVARFSMQEIREAAFLREALELAAIEVVAKTITDEQIALLKRNLRVQEVLVADGDQAGFYQTDSQMHELILSFTGFRRVAPTAEMLWVQVNRARQLVPPRPGRLQATIKEHKAIIAALEAHEPYGARAAVRTHLRQLVSLLEDAAKQKPELFADPARKS